MIHSEQLETLSHNKIIWLYSYYITIKEEFSARTVQMEIENREPAPILKEIALFIHKNFVIEKQGNNKLRNSVISLIYSIISTHRLARPPYGADTQYGDQNDLEWMTYCYGNHNSHLDRRNSRTSNKIEAEQIKENEIK